LNLGPSRAIGICVKRLILEQFKTIPPGGDSGLIRVWAERSIAARRAIGDRWLWDSVLLGDVQVDVVREERVMHHA
jgi:hypothetical protein